MEKKLLRKDLECYQIGQDDLELFRQDLKEKREAADKKFFAENEELMDRITRLSEEQCSEKEKIVTAAKQEYDTHQNKKLLGGLGIQIRKKVLYEEKDAMNWAKEHSMCLSLDKRSFEKIAKTQEMSFVQHEENILVTFPKNISFGDGDDWKNGL